MSSTLSELKTTFGDFGGHPSPKLSYNSSAFFDASAHPTITDQVFMCRQIAKQLVCDESNAKSKGRQMFEKRVQKSSKWVTTSDDQTDDASEQSFHSTTITEGPPNLRLLLDPRHVQDLNSLCFESNESEIMREDVVCRHLSKAVVEDLTSPEIKPNKGNALFAKRQQKSSEWIVDSVVDSVVDAVVQSAQNKLNRQTDDEWTPMGEEGVRGGGGGGPEGASGGGDESKVLARGFQGYSASFRDFNSRAKPFSRMY